MELHNENPFAMAAPTSAHFAFKGMVNSPPWV
jgi:hypothetical protein